MELGRECLQLWGYKRVDELIWVKTNQLQRLIRTGRTGHWLNHSKEHCLVGVKGSPQINRNLDCDVLVAEVGQGTSTLFSDALLKQQHTACIMPTMCPNGGMLCAPVLFSMQACLKCTICTPHQHGCNMACTVKTCRAIAFGLLDFLAGCCVLKCSIMLQRARLHEPHSMW